jgi:hypothetical protein
MPKAGMVSIRDWKEVTESAHGVKALLPGLKMQSLLKNSQTIGPDSLLPE